MASRNTSNSRQSLSNQGISEQSDVASRTRRAMTAPMRNQEVSTDTMSEGRMPEFQHGSASLRDPEDEVTPFNLQDTSPTIESAPSSEPNTNRDSSESTIEHAAERNNSVRAAIGNNRRRVETYSLTIPEPIFQPTYSTQDITNGNDYLKESEKIYKQQKFLLKVLFLNLPEIDSMSSYDDWFYELETYFKRIGLDCLLDDSVNNQTSVSPEVEMIVAKVLNSRLRAVLSAENKYRSFEVIRSVNEKIYFLNQQARVHRLRPSDIIQKYAEIKDVKHIH